MTLIVPTKISADKLAKATSNFATNRLSLVEKAEHNTPALRWSFSPTTSVDESDKLKEADAVRLVGDILL